MKKLFFAITILIPFISFGQAPDIEWEKNYGGSESEGSSCIEQTMDGGYIVAGTSYSNDGDVEGNHGSIDYWIVKLDDIGNIIWEKNLGGSGQDYANFIHQTTDEGYIVVGWSQSSDGDVGGNYGSTDCWVVKLDDIGNITWEKNLGGSEGDSAYSIRQTTDGGYIVAGSSASNDGDVSGNYGNEDYWVVKLDDIGNIIWEKNYGGSNNDRAKSIWQTTDGGYIIAGYSYSNDGDVSEDHGSVDYWIVKLDGIGNITWEKSLGGSNEDYANFIQQTLDGGYIVVGGSQSNDGDVSGNHGYADYWIVKLDPTGNIAWEQNYGGSSGEAAHFVQQTLDGSYIIAGGSQSNDGDVSTNQGGVDYWIVKLDAIGDIIWQKSIGGSSNDYAQAVQQTEAGDYIVTGHSESSDGDVNENYGSSDYWVVKLGNTARINDLGENLVAVYPNPVKDILTIAVQNTQIQNISILDITGKLVKQYTGITNTINVGELVSGVYFIAVNTDKGVYQSKFVKE